MSEDEKCPDCGKPADSFACKIRHLNFDTQCFKGDH